MKSLILFFVLGTALLLGAKEKKEETYTKADFELAVEKEVKARLDKAIDRIKKKSVSELTREILRREEGLEGRSKKLDLEELKLKNSVKDFERRIQEFEMKQDQFFSCVDKNNQEKDLRVKKMVEVIAQMKANRAADLIAVQDQQIAIKILSKLDTTKASKIFNLLEKEKSAELQKLYLNMKK